MDDLDHSMKISDHDWLDFFKESEECCLLQASLACPDSSGLSDADDPDITTQTPAPIQEHPAEGDCEKHRVVEEEGSKCSSDVDGKGGSDPKSGAEHMKSALRGDFTTCAERERWFVTVNDKPSQQLVPAAVVKKKRKHKKICKVDWMNKDKSLGDIDVPEQTFSTDSSFKGDNLHHLDKERTNESINVKCETNQVKSSDTVSARCSESGQTQLSTDLICVSCEESVLALQNTSEPKEIKCDASNERTKYSKTLDAVFIHEKDRDESSNSLQTKLTMDLTCLQDSTIDNLDNSYSTKVKNSTCIEKSFQTKINVEMTSPEDPSTERKLQNFALERIKTDTSNDFDRINQTINSFSEVIQDECSKLNNLTSFGASCNKDSLDLTSENTAEPEVDPGKPTDDLVISHTNSIESDEFADYDTFSSSSYDSETYHSATESIEDPRYLSRCNLSISINDDSLTHGQINFTNRCLKQDDGLSYTESSRTVPSAKPNADNTPDENSTCNIVTDGTALCMLEDTTTFVDNSFDQPESLPQRDITMESPETYAKATGSTRPVYAISAFWDEMEKMTINDILQIRMGRCMLPIEEAIITDDVEHICRENASIGIVDSINVQENAFLDTLDTTDSDYCTNVDESKPDRSSCDFSTSDFEEEYWQFINSSRNSSPDQHDKCCQGDYMDNFSKGEESDEMGTPVPPEDCSGQTFCGSTANSCNLAIPQQIRKNKSMYNIHASKSLKDLSSQAFWNQKSCRSLEEPLKMSDNFEVVMPLMCHTDEQYQISFPKVFEYLFDENKAKCEAMLVSVYGHQGDYASPMTDYTFFTAPNDQALMHYIEEPIPIFSCSRPSVRELTFPKPGCIFLGTNYTAMKDVSPIQLVSKSILRGMDCKHTDRSFCFSQDLTSLYSVKKICFLDKGSDVWRDQAEDEEKQVDATDSNITVVSEEGVLSVTPRMFKEAALWQISMEKNQMPSDYQSIFSTIKQSDMCLVCIAFASWVLRSSDPEGADAWKAALLANVSALSAIQYLRRYMKKKTSPQDE